MRLLPLLVFTLTSGIAQNVTAPEKATEVPPRSLRLLPLGETPPYRHEVSDGVSRELEPDPNNIPPRQVRLGDDPTSKPLRLNLGIATEPVKIPGGTAPVILRESKAPVDPALKPWLTLHPPAAGDVLAVIWRDPKTPWKQPRAIIFPDTAAALPAGSIRIVNLLAVEVVLIFGSDRVLLAPGKALVKAIAIGTDHPVQIAFKINAGQYHGFYSGSVLLNPNERAQIFIHRADGEKPRQAAKVVTFNEAAPPPPRPQP
ncbi:MAG: hypothetical protein NTW21_16370 [Verrucomicrobia bacterium]|nr:hypothetical protein [Verrucomicrobiota bacterium]